MLKITPVPVVHQKTGNIYYVLFSDVIECTNGREEKRYVIYSKDGRLFCREQEEFEQKFKEVT